MRLSEFGKPEYGKQMRGVNTSWDWRARRGEEGKRERKSFEKRKLEAEENRENMRVGLK